MSFEPPAEPSDGSAEAAEQRLLASLGRRRALAEAVLARWALSPDSESAAESSWDAPHYFWWRRMSPFWALRRRRRPAWPVSVRDEAPVLELPVNVPTRPEPRSVWERIRAIFAPAQRQARDASPPSSSSPSSPTPSKARVIQSAAKSLSYVGPRQLAEAPPAIPTAPLRGPSLPQSNTEPTPLDMIAPLSLRIFDRTDLFLTKGAAPATADERRAAPSRLFWWPGLGRLAPSVSSAAPRARIIKPEAPLAGTPTPAVQEPSEPLPETSAQIPEPALPEWPPLTPPQGAVRVVYEGIHVGRRRPRGIAAAASPDDTAPTADLPVAAQPPGSVSLMPPPAPPLPPPSQPGLLGHTQQHHAIIRSQELGRLQLLAGVETSRNWAADHVIHGEDMRISAPAASGVTPDPSAPAVPEAPAAMGQPSWLTRVFHPWSARHSGAVEAATTMALHTEMASRRGGATPPVAPGESTRIGGGASPSAGHEVSTAESPSRALRRPVAHGPSQVRTATDRPSVLTRVLHALPRRLAVSAVTDVTPVRSVGNASITRSTGPVRDAPAAPRGEVASTGSSEPTAAIGRPAWLTRVFHSRPRRPAMPVGSPAIGSTSAEGGESTPAARGAATSAESGEAASAEPGESTSAGHGEAASSEGGVMPSVANVSITGSSVRAHEEMRGAASFDEVAPASHGEVPEAVSSEPTAAIGRPAWFTRVFHPRPRRSATPVGSPAIGAAIGNTPSGGEQSTSTSARGGESASTGGGEATSVSREAPTTAEGGESAPTGRGEATSAARDIATSEGGALPSGGDPSITGSSVPLHHEERRGAVSPDEVAPASRAEVPEAGASEPSAGMGRQAWLTRVFHPSPQRRSETEVHDAGDADRLGQRPSRREVAAERALETTHGGSAVGGASEVSVAVGEPSWVTRVLRAVPRRPASSDVLKAAAPSFASPTSRSTVAGAARALEVAAPGEPPRAWLTRVLQPRPKRGPLDAGAALSIPTQAAVADDGSPMSAQPKRSAVGFSPPGMVTGRRRDEPRSAEGVDLAEGPMSEARDRTDAGAERQAALVQILARLPEAMAAQALAAGVLGPSDTGPTDGAAQAVAELAGAQAMTVAYAPVAMVSSPARRRGSSSAATADGPLGTTTGGTLTSASEATRSGMAAMGSGMAATGGRSVATGASGGAVAASGGSASGELQRTMASPGGTTSNSLVQRVLDEPGGESTPLDVDALADEVFTRLRWRLSAERERMFG
jgi:hypothetical protein